MLGDDAPHHQSGAGEEHGRQCQLRDHEPRSPPPLAGCAAVTGTRLHEPPGNTASGCIKRWHQTEDDPGAEAGQRQECEDPPVHCEVHPIRQAASRHEGILEHLDRCGGESQAHGPRDSGEQDTLDEELTDNLHAARAHGQTHGDLARAVRRACQQQVGDIRARHQQHERHHRHEDWKGGPETAANGGLTEQRNPRQHGAIRRRIRGRERGGNASEVLGGLRGRCTRCQPAEALERSDIALLARVGGHLRERLPQPGPGRKREALGHDANHRGRHAIDANGSADHRRVAFIARVPQRVAQDHDWRRAGTIVARVEAAPDGRCMADEAERVRRDKRSGEALRGSLVRDVHRGLEDSSQAIERALRRRPVLEIEI